MRVNEFRKPIQYKMPDVLARALLKSREGEDTKKRPNEYLCKVVNEQFGLMGYCVKVLRY